MGKKVRISNESINCYGTRVLTSGVDLSQYERNPVLLYMHERGTIVGKVENLHVEGQDIVGELAFDCATELSQTLKKQWEFGSLRMVSANFQVLETSKDKSLVMEGQTRETVTRSKLFEVSVVDIGGNDDAIVLSYEGKNLMPLAMGADNVALPLLNEEKSIHNNPLNRNNMELKQIALALGLAETATEQEVTAKIESIKLSQAKVSSLEAQVTILQNQQAQMQLAAVTAAVDTAIQEKRIPATMKDHFVELGKKVGLDTLKTTFSAMQPQVKLSQTLHRTSNGQIVAEENDFSKYERLSAVPSSLMEDLHDHHQEEFVRLFKAEYGTEPEACL